MLNRLHGDERGLVSVIVLFVAILAAIPLTFTACTTRLEEARARQAEAEVKVEREKTEQRRVDREIVEEERRIEEAKVELEETRGQNMIRKAVAQDVTRQSRMYALLQWAWIPLAAVALFGLGLFIAWFFVGENGPYQRRWFWPSTEWWH